VKIFVGSYPLEWISSSGLGTTENICCQKFVAITYQAELGNTENIRCQKHQQSYNPQRYLIRNN